MVLQIQPQAFKSSYIKLIALLWSTVMALLIQIFAVAFPNGGNPSLIVFFIIAIIYMTTAIIYIVIRNVKKNCKCLKVVWLADIAYFIGGLMYYVGKIYSPTVIQTSLLGTAAVIFRFIPFFISKYYQSNLVKERRTTEAKLQLVPEWILAAESLTMLVDFDSWYTVMTNSFLADFIYIPHDSDFITYGFDPHSRIVASWVVLAFFVLTYLTSLYYTMNIQYWRTCNISISCVISNFSTIVLVAAFSMHLLADKHILLQYSGANVTAASIAMNALVLIVVITVIVLLLVYRCLSKTRQEKLLPRALYQHVHRELDEQKLVFAAENVDNDNDCA